jgi:hypothetical protein
VEDIIAIGGFFVTCIVAFLAFAQTIPYEFVFDDDFQILRNPWIRNWSSLGQVFTSNVWQFMNPHMVSNYYRPLQMVLPALSWVKTGPIAATRTRSRP